MTRHARWPMRLGLAYAVLVGCALVLALLPNGDGTGGIFSALLALPWTLLGVFLLDAINPLLLDTFGPVLAVAGGLLNAWLVYVIARKLQKRTT